MFGCAVIQSFYRHESLVNISISLEQCHESLCIEGHATVGKQLLQPLFVYSFVIYCFSYVCEVAE